MKKVMLSLVLLFALAPCLKAQTTDKLIVEVNGLKNNKGMLVLDIFNSGKGFPMETKHALKRLIVKPENGQGRFVIENLPQGTYALAVVHDENQSGTLDTNVLGMPKEDACALQNAKGFLGPPHFEDAKFSWPQNQKKMVITMLYF
ncbi:MAG TPA: hypothetical protein DCG19_02160 [Cryomorphaceae bacterium]|nr:hypothetical protein [Owenweeksia sp.]MBF99379.1 hypothetical protein [Owenweeksia sp.]HAD96176.1 hypothetical protein [Cryomorphaceae bacterium]HBF19453.1 hypothetical protein [Cryomorphaceae bacterium]|tara:strand:+ start:520 stop:957 length:438 start_codon:yes stop_codon:yes gene_type:complete